MDTWAHIEMMGSTIRDVRRRKSMAVVLNNLAEKPGISFSAAAGPAKRQAAHRLFDDAKVDVDQLLSGHYQQVRNRVTEASTSGLVLLLQDTSSFNFTGLKATTGLGYVNETDTRCLFGHSVLAITSEGMPLGVAHLELWARDDKDYGKGKDRRKHELVDKESYRWIRTLHTVEQRMPKDQHVLFVQDREADIFAFLESPTRPTTHVLVRAARPRNVEVDSECEGAPPTKGSLFDVVSAAPIVGVMQVTIPRAPNRSERAIELTLQAVRLRILPPKGRKGVSDNPVTVWAVRAIELSPPSGEKAVEWVLLSTMPIADGAAACKLVGYYSKRWTIERLHYAIKSGGCKAEQLQMDDASHIKLALSLYYVTAWRLLSITYLARIQPDAPPELILSPTEIEVLKAIEKKPVTTTSNAVRAIAKLGGHEPYKNGPPPGIKVLWIGLRRLEDMEIGWLLAREEQTSPSPNRYDT